MTSFSMPSIQSSSVFAMWIAVIALSFHCTSNEPPDPLGVLDSAGGAGADDGVGGGAGASTGGLGGVGAGTAGAFPVDSGSDQSVGGGGMGGASGNGGMGGASGNGGMGGTSGNGGTGGASGNGGTGGASGNGGTDDAAGGSGASDVSDGALSDGDADLDRRSIDDCSKGTCLPPNGQYCGLIGDSCGGTLDCGACPTGQICGARTQGVCGTPCPLCGQVPTCSDASVTTISGKVFTGALNNADPIYNASVFIPNIPLGAKLPPFTDGPSCDRCTPFTHDNSLASAITAPDGSFTLTGNIPAGTGIPLVVQLGKWRRQITIDVNPCASNVLPAGTVRLPRNQNEGDIPLTAISTGDVDKLQCVLRKIGIEDSEFTNPGGTGRIQIYRSNGSRIDANTPAEVVLTGTATGAGDWNKYTQILFPCEGREQPESVFALGNFLDYVNKGGRALTTHFSYAWLFTNVPLANIGTWTTGGALGGSPLTSQINTAFPKGNDFATWLGIVGALSNSTPPEVTIDSPRFNLGALAATGGAQLWISSTTPASIQHVTIDTPIQANPDLHCGRVVFSDFHVANSATSSSTFPSECFDPLDGGDQLALTAQEKILEFMLFDLASCVGVRPATPPPPPPPPKF